MDPRGEEVFMAAETREVKFFGFSVEDFTSILSQHVTTGKYFDGTEVPGEIKEALAGLVNVLQSPKKHWTHYVIAWSTHVLVNIERKF
jgi:hypothetical protein